MCLYLRSAAEISERVSSGSRLGMGAMYSRERIKLLQIMWIDMRARNGGGSGGFGRTPVVGRAARLDDVTHVHHASAGLIESDSLYRDSDLGATVEKKNYRPPRWIRLSLVSNLTHF
jgi:hypothetical protein